MKRFFVILGLFTLSSLSLSAQSNRNHRNFDGIDVRISADIILTQSNTYSVRLEVPQRYLQQITTTVRNNTLIINSRGNISSYNETFKIFVSAPHFKNINLSGSGNVKIDRLREPHVNLNLAGSGNVEINSADFTTCYMAISGSGNVDIAGRSGFLDIALSGSGNVEALQFNAQTVKATIAGSGNINVNAIRTLNATVAGSGNVGYRGNPRVTKDIQGSGEVSRL